MTAERSPSVTSWRYTLTQISNGWLVGTSRSYRSTQETFELDPPAIYHPALSSALLWISTHAAQNPGRTLNPANAGKPGP